LKLLNKAQKSIAQQHRRCPFEGFVRAASDLHPQHSYKDGGTTMSLLDDLKATIGDAASTARDVGQTLGAQAQAQLAIKKLQLEQARKYHELGTRTHEWHKAGNLVAAGPVPRDVQELCLELDDINGQLDDQTLKLEEAKRQAELRSESRSLNRSVPTVEATMTATPLDSTSTQSGSSGMGTVPTGSATSNATTSPDPDVVLDIPNPTYVIDTPPQAAPSAATPDTTPSTAPGNSTPGEATLSDPHAGNLTRPLGPNG
jgi:hypothetical protein